MKKKGRSRKGRGSRSVKSERGAEQRTENRSFGSGLDAVGFRPLGRRILVSKPRSVDERAKAERETKTSAPIDGPGPYADDPLGYDTSDPSWGRRAAEHALSGADKDAIEKEVREALRRWGLSK